MFTWRVICSTCCAWITGIRLDRLLIVFSISFSVLWKTLSLLIIRDLEELIKEEVTALILATQVTPG